MSTPLQMPPRIPVDDFAGHAWPAVASGDRALMRSLCLQLDSAQWLGPDALRARQQSQRSRLIEFAWRQVPYYRERWRAAGLSPETLRDQETWQRLPVLTREQVQNSSAELRAEQYPSAHGGINLVRTSGSTGRPVEVAKSALSNIVWRVVALRDHDWHRRDLLQVIATIRVPVHGPAPYPQGRRAKDWGVPTSLLYRTGPSVLLDVTTPVENQLEWLQRQNAAYLLTYPSNALALAQVSLAKGETLSGLRQVRTIGESAPDELRATIMEAWGVEVADIYSTQEVGYIAIQCPDNPGILHTQDETVLTELLDEQGLPCPPGKAGRVVVTPLLNFAMPLIRYAVGDYAVPGEPCTCGRGLGVLSDVLGRVRNMMRLADGGVAWPRFGSSKFLAIAPITQYQFVQTALGQMVARVAVAEPLTTGQKAALIDLVRRSIGHPFEVTVEEVQSIPRSASGKFEEFVCAMPDAG